MRYENFLVEKSEGIATVTLNRPASLNAMSRRMREELLDLALAMRGDLETRFIIFTGAGRAFSAGADVKEMKDSPDEGPPPPVKARLGQFPGHDLARTAENMEQITIAAVNGLALGAGMGLCMLCDFRILSEKAYFGIPEAAVGLFYTWGCTPRLVRLVGPAWAKDLIMTCRNVDAQEAMRIGLAHRVVAPDRQEAVNSFLEKRPPKYTGL
jgi:enoyl-CoA hydratase/carnithine racemase